MQIQARTVRAVTADDFVARRTARAEVQHLGIDTVTRATLGKLEDHLFDAPVAVRVVRLEEMQDLDHWQGTRMHRASVVRLNSL